MQWNNRWKGIGNRVQQRFHWAKTQGAWSLLLCFSLPWYATGGKSALPPPLLLLVHWCAMDLCVCIYRCLYMWLCARPFSHKKTKSRCKVANVSFKTSAFISRSLGAFCRAKCPMGSSRACLWVTSRALSRAILRGKQGTEQWGSSWEHGKGAGLCPWHVRGHPSWGRGRNPGWKDFVDFTTFWVTFGSALFASYFYRAIKWEETWVFHSSLTSGTIPSPSCQETHPSHWPLAPYLKRIFNSFLTFQMEMSQTELVAS